MRPLLRIDQTKCIGCHQCELACSLRHHGMFAPWLARVRVTFNDLNCEARVSVCWSCPERSCVSACPISAIRVDERTGMPVIDDEACLGCGQCVERCPHHVIWLNPEGTKAVKCDLCGGVPVCLSVCPTGALFGGDGNDAEGGKPDGSDSTRESTPRGSH